jgi:predicted amidohydrolase YtcJ
MASEFLVWSAVERLGAKRARWLYPLKTLLNNGIRIIAGSDCPMEPLNPLLGIQEAVSRDYFSEERVSAEEALRMYTFDAAYSSSEENVKGSIEEGKLADFTVLSRDPLSVVSDELSSISVEMTIVAGCIVFPKHDFRSKT